MHDVVDSELRMVGTAKQIAKIRSKHVVKIFGQPGLTFEGVTPMPSEIKSADADVQREWEVENWGTDSEISFNNVVELRNGNVRELRISFRTIGVFPHTWFSGFVYMHPEVTITATCEHFSRGLSERISKSPPKGNGRVYEFEEEPVSCGTNSKPFDWDLEILEAGTLAKLRIKTSNMPLSYKGQVVWAVVRAKLPNDHFVGVVLWTEPVDHSIVGDSIEFESRHILNVPNGKSNTGVMNSDTPGDKSGDVKNG